MCNDDYLNRAQVLGWFAHFQGCGESLEDVSCPGRSVSGRSKENVEKNREFLLQDRQITTRLFAEHIGAGKEAARRILKRVFQARKIVSRFVPLSLTAEQSGIKFNVVAVSSGLLTNFATRCKQIMTVGGTWCFLFNPAILQRNHNGVVSVLRCTRQSGRKKYLAKKILIVFFFDAAGIIHSAFVCEVTTVESLLFWTSERSVRACVPCQKRTVPKQQLVVFAGQGARLLGR